MKEHYATMSSHKINFATLWTLFVIAFAIFLLIFVVAEDVSLTGGAAIQRIRLIDEEEQV